MEKDDGNNVVIDKTTGQILPMDLLDILPPLQPTMALPPESTFTTNSSMRCANVLNQCININHRPIKYDFRSPLLLSIQTHIARCIQLYQKIYSEEPSIEEKSVFTKTVVIEHLLRSITGNSEEVITTVVEEIDTMIRDPKKRKIKDIYVLAHKIKCLDISRKAITSRKRLSTQPTWRDDQILLLQVTLSCLLILHGYLDKEKRYENVDDWLLCYPELRLDYIPINTNISVFDSNNTKVNASIDILASAIDDRDKKRLIKLRGKDLIKELPMEVFKCNILCQVRSLFPANRDVIKCNMIFLVAFVAGDGRGFMGRDKSAHTLRLEMYFERETGIAKRYARGSVNGNINLNNNDSLQIIKKESSEADGHDEIFNLHSEHGDRKRQLPDTESEKVQPLSKQARKSSDQDDTLQSHNIGKEVGYSSPKLENGNTAAKKATFSYCFTQFNDIPVSIMKKLQLTLVQVPKYFDSALSIEASILPLEQAPLVVETTSDGGSSINIFRKSYKTQVDRSLDDFFSLVSINNSSTVIEYHY